MRINYSVTGNERKALVKVISETTGAKAVYKFMPTCAYEIDYFTVTKEGVLEFDDRADSEEVEAVLEALAAAGFEGVGETAEAPEEEAQEAATAADSAPESETASLTVRFPMKNHTGTTLRNLINLLFTREKLINKALGTSFHVEDGLAEALRDDACALTKESLLRAVADYEDAHGPALGGITLTPEDITFASLPETEDTAVLRTFTALCGMMNKQALEQKRIQAREVNDGNEKYALRIWLTRLGMNGAEYKEARTVLMRNLSGHCAFRTEADKEKWLRRQAEKRDALKAAKAQSEEAAV